MPVMKLSEGKASWPGAKQVWRCYDARGSIVRDVIELADAAAPESGAEPLLVPFVRDGRLVASEPSLSLAAAREILGMNAESAIGQSAVELVRRFEIRSTVLPPAAYSSVSTAPHR